ncbi:MAG TPA: DNA mismatch repair protein MutT [Eubacterium sp.]|nr:DNA mismatch repair protein MutT [Eubacterium sp.]HBZ53188.1 DNA mismatch repair protein MutT [Eubacterium sp.]
MELTTLVYIRHEDSYLMLYRNKKDKDINKGKYIGVGGHFLEGESPVECAVREVKEETGLTVGKLDPRGIVTFVYGDVVEYMHLFTCDEYEGELIDCDEGELSFVPFSQVMDLELWEGDRIFLRKLMDGDGYFFLKLIYDEQGKLVDYRIS